MPVRIASWNVESIRSHLDQVLRWLDSSDAHVVCLQETRASRRTFPMAAFEEVGYQVVVHGGEGGRGGVAVASRLPVDGVVLGLPGAVAPLDEPRSIAVTIAGLRLVTVYAPNGRKVGTRHHEVKLAWFSLLSAWLDLERSDFGDLLLAGDLNIAPLDLDVWAPDRYRKRNLFSAPERAAFERLLGDGALVDIVRDRHRDEHVYTWWNRRSDFYETDRGWRLDHVLATPSVASRVSSCSVDRDERGRLGSTDHAPVLVEIEDAISSPAHGKLEP